MVRRHIKYRTSAAPHTHTHTHNPRHPSLKRSHRRRLLIKTAALPPAHYTKGSLSSSTPAVSVLLTGCLVTAALIAFRRVSRCLFRLFSRGRRCVRACARVGGAGIAPLHHALSLALTSSYVFIRSSPPAIMLSKCSSPFRPGSCTEV